ncbi:MAG TPA: type II secretion system F family protein [Bacillota bacterium]|nr:type II secretion system F family protein [Bacillota bacterium]
MLQFRYEGRTRAGKREKGTIKAISVRDAMVKLRAKGVAVTSVKQVEVSFLNQDITFGSPVKLQDMVIFLRQFCTLLQAGISIVDSTKILSNQTDSKALRQALIVVEEDLREGKPLSEASAKHSKIFPNMFVNMVQAGEIGGKLEESLDRVAVYFEKQYHTRQKVKSALAYPAILGFIAVAVVTFLLVFVVPTFTNMFSSFGAKLPAITQFVLSASSWMGKYWWMILLAGVICQIILIFLRRNTYSKYYLDYVTLRMPILGKIIQKAALARMTRTLSSLFSSSVPILNALSIVENIVENEVIARVLRESRTSLENGQPLTDPMRSHWVFPPLVTHMIAIGEQTGSLDLMLGKVADFYEKEVENATDRLKSLVEPLMILFLAVVVGTIVSSIMVPMFDIFNHVHQ